MFSNVQNQKYKEWTGENVVSVQAENKIMRGEAGDTMDASQETENGWVAHSAEPLGEH